MKKVLQLLLVGFIINFTCAVLCAQNPTNVFDLPDKIDWEAGTNAVINALRLWYTWVYLVISMATPYLQRIPAVANVLNKIGNRAWQAAIVAVLVALAFIKMGGAEALPIMLAMLAIINPYEMFLKPLFG